MILPIDEKWRIKADEHQWIVQCKEKSKKTGKIRWRSTAYCVSLEHAVRLLCETRIRTCNAQTLSDALVEIDRVCTVVTGALTPKVDVGFDFQITVKRGKAGV